MTLYEIAQDFLALMQDIENGNIPEEAIKDTLECVELAFEEKADNIACYIKNLNAEAAAIKVEEERLAERRKAKEKEAERLQSYLADMLQQTGIEKVETARNKMTFRKNPPKVVFNDEKAFIEWAVSNEKSYYLNYGKPTINKTNVKEAINGGEAIPGAQIITEKRLQIQ